MFSFKKIINIVKTYLVVKNLRVIEQYDNVRLPNNSFQVLSFSFRDREIKRDQGASAGLRDARNTEPKLFKKGSGCREEPARRQEP